MKKIIAVLFFSVVCFGQVKQDTVSFSDATTSALVTCPNWAYLGGIAKPDSGGNIITFEVELHEDSTRRYDLLTALADSVYTITLPDSTSDYVVSLPKDVFDPWKYFRIKFAKATTCVITLIWKQR